MDRGWSGYLTLYSMEKNVTTAGAAAHRPEPGRSGDALRQPGEPLNEDWAKFIVLYRQNGQSDSTEAGEDIATAGDLDLTKEGSNKLTQVLDLIGAKVQVAASGGW